MRTGIIQVIHESMRKNKNIYFLTGDLGYSVLEEMEKEFPGRVIDIGVAEQNMVGIAAGLALSGNKVYIYSIIPFVTMRCYEQIRNDICYHNLDVTILGAGAGLSYGILSATHFALEDIAIIRPLLNISIFSPSDETEAILGMKHIVNSKVPTYVRIGKKSEPVIYEKPFAFIYGKGNVVKKGKDVVVFATGAILFNALAAAELLKKKNIDIAVVDIHTIKPLDTKIIRDMSKGKKLIVTVEEHSLYGGLGSAVAEIIAAEKNSAPLKIIAAHEKYPERIGSHDYLRSLYGLSTEKIAKQIESSFKKNT